MAGASTRLAIIQHALDDAEARLAEVPTSAATRAIRVRLQGYRRALDRWQTTPPAETQREALLKAVLEMELEVMKLARAASG